MKAENRSFTWWRSRLVLVLILVLLQGSQQLFDLIGEVGLLDQVLSGLVTRRTLTTDRQLLFATHDTCTQVCEHAAAETLHISVS